MECEIQARREKVGWSRQVLARAAGVSRETVRLIEAGKTSPLLGTRHRIERALAAAEAEEAATCNRAV